MVFRVMITNLLHLRFKTQELYSRCELVLTNSENICVLGFMLTRIYTLFFNNFCFFNRYTAIILLQSFSEIIYSNLLKEPELL